MPLIVVGADTSAGRAILGSLNPTEREIRLFVSDEETGGELRARGFKVAIGDVSDESHIQAALMRCFTAVLVAEAASDDRERSFAASSDEVLASWARAAGASGVRRLIWVLSGSAPESSIGEVAVVDPADPQLPERVLALDDARTLD
jgi:nucleoside-diphosphate-sugar epimerase